MARNPIRSALDLARLRVPSQDVWVMAADAVTRAISENLYIPTAARLEGTTLASVKKYFPEDIEKDAFGRWVAKSANRSYHGDMHLPVLEGDRVVDRVVAIRGSRARSDAARLVNATTDFLEGRDPGAVGLSEFRDHRIAGYDVPSDLDVDAIEEGARQGEFDWLELYERR
jgi:hypothetical protein